MRSTSLKVVLLAALLGVAAARAQVPPAELLVPPADAERFAIVSLVGTHGSAWRWRKDGVDHYRESILLRGFVWEQDQTIRLGADGRESRIVIRGTTPQGNAAETFSLEGGRAVWRSQVDSGSVVDDGKSRYAAAGGAWTSIATFAELLWRSPDRRAPLLPGGEARLSKLVDIDVGQGPTSTTVTAWTIDGIDFEPAPVLLRGDGTFFGQVVFMGILPEAHAGDFAKLREAQEIALAARGPAVVARFGQISREPVAFTNVRLFDAERAAFDDDRTVVVERGTIVAVGPTATTPVPIGARIVPGAGRTLVPGLWDAHQHVGSDAAGVMLLSLGITSVRDPGADIGPTVARRERIARGELLFPAVYPSLLIDGKGPLQAQIGRSVASAEETVQAVRAAKASGFSGVKFYTSMTREWLVAGVDEARRLGLHVHGHVPASLRPADAIDIGYDEITHINFVVMQAMPDAVIAVSNGLARIQGPGRYAKDLDLDAEPLRSLMATMARRGTTVDPTLVTFESSYVPEKGELAAAYASFAGTMPPVTERGLRSGGSEPPPGVSRADYRASFAKMVELVQRLHRAGVPIVAGTDGSGMEIVRELELYVQAGLTPGEALRTATLVPARLVGADGTTGSVAVGKRADLVLVEGDVSRDIGALRRTVWVMAGGALMDAEALRRQAGFAGRPR